MPRKGGDIRPSSKARRALRHQLHTEQLGKCFWCECDLELSAMQLDRVRSGKFGGTYRYSNVVGACEACNIRRGHDEAKNVNKREAQRLYTPVLRKLAAQRGLAHA